MYESLQSWINTVGFMPHGHCFLWTPDLLRLFIVSEVAIIISYYSIPLGLWYFARKRPDFHYNYLLLMFGVFIFACGTTHLLALWNIWNSAYWLQGWVEFVTGMVSLATAFLLWPLLPQLLNIPSRDQLEQANRELQRQIQLVRDTSDTLAASEKRYRQLMEIAAEGIWVLDRHGCTTYANRRMAEMLGVAEDQLSGRYFREFHFEPHADADLPSEHVVFHFRRTDGEELIAIVATSPIDDNGQVSGLLCVVTDITERERIGRELAQLTMELEVRVEDRTSALATANLELQREIQEHRRTARSLSESESWLRAILNSTLDGIISINAEGLIQSVNPAVSRIFGYGEAELIGQKINQLMPNPEGEQHDPYLANFHATGIPKIIGIGREVMGRRKDGTTFHLDIAVSAMHVDGDPQYVAVLRDINERKQTEAEIHQLNAELVAANARLESQNSQSAAAEDQLTMLNRQLRASVETLQQQTQDIQFLNEMSELLQSCSGLAEATVVIGGFTQRFFDADSGGLYLFQEGEQIIREQFSWGQAEESEPVFRIDDCWAVRHGRMHPVTPLQSDLHCSHLHLDEQRFSMCIPMFAQGHHIGLINLRSDTPFFQGGGSHSLQIAQTFSEQTALAIANIILRESLRNQSICDPLTGLFNRRHLDDRLQLELAKGQCDDSTFSVMLLDLDHFKHFNDSYGHECGDFLLKTISDLLQQQVREDDIVTRFGGEEFVVLMPHASLAVAMERAEHIRQAVAVQKIIWHEQVLGPVTISAGVACFPDHGSSQDQLISAADNAMFRAKDGGRNRVIHAEIPPSQMAGPT